MNTKKTALENKYMGKAIETLSGIFIPILHVLMAGALLKGILMLLLGAGLLDETGGTYLILFAIADGFFYFLPIFLAYTAANKLKADPFTAMIIAAAMLYPDITEKFHQGINLEFLSFPIKPVTYSSSVIPIILAVALLHYVELPLEKYLPTVMKGFMKPLLAIVVVVPITFAVFGPLGTLIGQGLASAYAIIYQFNPIVAGLLFGLIWQPMVVFGFHWGLVPVIISNINNYGVDTILPLLGPAVFGQAGAAMAVSLITKNKKLKSVAFSGSLTAILGVTEPALYGVNLPLKRPMVAACIAGAIGGGVVGTSNAGAVSFAFPSVPSLIVYLGEGFWTFFMACLLGFVLGFILTWILGFKKEHLEELYKTES